MKKNIIMIFMLIVIISVAGCEKVEFEGTIIDTDNSFILEYSVLNMMESHELDLTAGDVINVLVEKESGKLDLNIKNSSEDEIYKGNDVSSGSFSVNISKSGKHTFTVSGKNTSGKVSFTIKDSN